MRLPPPISTRTDTLLPYTTLFRSEAGERQRFALGQRIADVEVAVVGNADDVARPGLLGQLAVARQEQHRVVHVDGLAAARMLQLGAALEVAGAQPQEGDAVAVRSEEHTSELQSLMRISYAVFCLKKKKK